jgi:hypothetical protein
VVGGKKEEEMAKGETDGEEEMVVSSEEEYVPDHIPSRKDIILFASVILPFAETGKPCGTHRRPGP